VDFIKCISNPCSPATPGPIGEQTPPKDDNINNNWALLIPITSYMIM
jgi:hypothetical protein